MKSGDTVKHRPTGETWLVAFVDGDYLAWAGWPPGLAKTAECDLVKECSPEESLTLLRRWAVPGSSQHERDHRVNYARRRLAELGEVKTWP